MIDANNAQFLSRNGRITHTAIELRKIEDAIIDATFKGERKCRLDLDTFSWAALDELEKLGYKVLHNDPFLDIEW